MNNVTRIVILSLCAALALSSCKKTTLKPEENHKVPVGFTAMSHTSATKADGVNEPLSEYHDDFGVWGIARKTGHDFILWEDNAMSRVAKSSATSYIPESDAYWMTGYTHTFLAVAPFDFGGTDLNIDKETNTLSFNYDMSQKYEKETYAFDLMAAVAQSTVGTPRTEAQDLEFYHLFSKICISVEFSGMTGTVKGMHLYNVDTDLEYTVLFDENKKIKVDYTLEDKAEEALKDIDYIADNASPWVLHIVPQYITDFELYLDYEIGGVSVKNFEVNLAAAKATPKYHSNQWYNWKIKITPKAITFDVTVQPWVDEDDEFEFELK